MACSIHHRARSLRLADGRRIAYAESGPRDGLGVIYCHGAIGSPLGPSEELDRITERLGIRYVLVNRPGFGGSDPSPGRTVLDGAGDLESVADALGLEQFAIVGVSAGGPYALAAALRLGERVRRVALISSLSPACPPHRVAGVPIRIRLGLGVVALAPGAITATGGAVLPVIRRYPELLHRVIAAHAARTERPALSRPEERAAVSSSFLEASAHGVGGMVQDYLTYARQGWGFDPGTVGTEVQIWHGVEDPLVPVEHALQLAVALPRCRFFLHPDAGHHFFRRRLEEIVGTLVDGMPAAPAWSEEASAADLHQLLARARMHM